MTTRLSGATTVYGSLLGAVMLTAIALLVYANTYNVPFIYDDTNRILTNPYMRMDALTLEDLSRIFKDKLNNRPAAMLSFAVNYYFGGYDVRGYHAVNLIIHILTAWLIFLIGRQTLSLCGEDGALPSFIGAVLWLVNPVHVQSVTYTVQRMNSQAAMFFLLTLFCYIRARLKAGTGQNRIRMISRYLPCLITGLLALASKENAATLPVMIFLYEWFFFQDLNFSWMKDKIPKLSLGLLLVAGLALIYLGDSPLEKILGGYRKHDFTPIQRLLTEPSVVIYYLSLLFFPDPGRLALIYDFPPFTSVLTPLTAFTGILGVFALVLAGFLSAKKQRLLSFAIFWYLGNLIIESSIFGLALVFEHRTYLPSIFLFIALSSLGQNAFRKKTLPVILFCLIAVVFSVLTHQRITVWTDAIRFWQDNAAKAPNDTTVHNNLGQALLVAGKTEQAEAHFNRALTIAPDCNHYNNLGLATMKKGDMEEAIAFFYQALRLSPSDANTHFNLGTAWFQKKDLDRARYHLQQAARYAPDPVLALNNLATVLVLQKEYGEAAETMNRLADLRPESPAVYYNLACVLALDNRKDDSVNALERAVGLGYNRWHHLKTDPDLKNIHDTAYFKSLGD